MLSKTKILIIPLAIFVFFFIGFINESNEYFEPELGLKYPSTTFLFNKPDLSDNTQNEYLKNSVLNKKLGFLSPIFCIIIIQLLISFLFCRKIKNYKIKNFLIDVLIFIFSSLVLYAVIGLGQVYYNKIYIIILFVLIINFLINFIVRNKILNNNLGLKL